MAKSPKQKNICDQFIVNVGNEAWPTLVVVLVVVVRDQARHGVEVVDWGGDCCKEFCQAV